MPAHGGEPENTRQKAPFLSLQCTLVETAEA